MKILFAISNENVLNKIVDSYRNRYGEAVSFKNVFYFNAIIREIQKDKTYDRIVISEDLEPFSNNNYDIIDKFIVERLKEISNEIQNNSVKKTDVIVICTDRRTKSSLVLTKMFEYKIYNALVGTDRRIDNVCDLINNPRNEREAQEYYKIEGQASSQTIIDDVSEQEMQNILIHYKKLGKNEDRYADSFNNIAAQYTDQQLKIIIKCLPINVRAVLEAECPKYQELVTYAGESDQERKAKQKIQEQRKLEQIEEQRKLKEKIEKSKNTQKAGSTTWNQRAPSATAEPELPSGIDILDQKRNQSRMTGNVIIPNSMNVRNERKIYSDDQLNQIQNDPRQGRMGDMASPTRDPQTIMQQRQEITEQQRPIPQEPAQPSVQRQVAHPVNEDLLSGFDNIELPQSPVERETQEATLPGLEDFDNMFNELPKENNEPEISLPGLDDIELPQSPVQVQENHTQVPIQEDTILPGFEDMILPAEPVESTQLEMPEVANEPEVEQEPKRGRGRPRKYPIEPPKPKGKRGRPRKNPLPEETVQPQIQPVAPIINQPEQIINQPEQQTQAVRQVQPLVGQPATSSSVQTYSQETQSVQELPGIEAFDDILNEPKVEIPETITNNVLPNEPEATPLPGLSSTEMSLPGLDMMEDDQDDILSSLSGLESTAPEESDLITSLPGIEDSQYQSRPEPLSETQFERQEFSQDTYSGKYVPPSMSRINTMETPVNQYSPSQDRIETIKKLEENRVYSTGSLNTVLTKDKKIVAFVGASKSGTSFLVNNLACLFSSLGVKTAILDMTKNKNSYYIYTNNDENLRNVAYTSIEKLENGVSEPIRIDRNLEVYTAMPNDGKDYSNTEAILSTLVQNSSLVLIDCDFDTDYGYFANSQEIYLVQSMDILTIQELTGFLRELKTKGILDQEKLRIVVNKELKVRNLSSKAVIGGMSFYNDPAMSYMTELFNKDKIRACTIPFDENVYSRYLEGIVNCVISINGYPKGFINSLKILGNMVYPLLSKQTYSTQKSPAEMSYGNNFSAEMSNTLNQMRNKY